MICGRWFWINISYVAWKWWLLWLYGMFLFIVYLCLQKITYVRRNNITMYVTKNWNIVHHICILKRSTFELRGIRYGSEFNDETATVSNVFVYLTITFLCPYIVWISDIVLYCVKLSMSMFIFLVWGDSANQSSHSSLATCNCFKM